VTLRETVSKYIEGAERALAEMRVTQSPVAVDEERALGIVDAARRYLEDAKYYRGRGKLGTSLASVAYCEGLLDGLRMLGVVEFSW